MDRNPKGRGVWGVAFVSTSFETGIKVSVGTFEGDEEKRKEEDSWRWQKLCRHDPRKVMRSVEVGS